MFNGGNDEKLGPVRHREWYVSEIKRPYRITIIFKLCETAPAVMRTR